MRIAHVSIRSHDLEGSRRFYVDILGLRVGPRPPFAFAGHWLYDSSDDGYGVVHLIGCDAASATEREAYLGKRSNAATGSGALDHVAFAMENWPALHERLCAAGIRYDERRVPGLGQLQVFVTDPSGVPVELAFDDS